MTHVHPAQLQPQVHQVQQQCHPLQAPLVYQIVASEQLPCFDPSIAIKHLFMSQEQGMRLARFTLKFRLVLVPMYLVGLLLRIVEMFVSVEAGKILAVLSVLFQMPSIFLTVMAFRYEYVKVLVRTFEFCFLASTVTLWVACCFTYVRDLRAVLLPITWIDFVDLVLIETYFGRSKTIFLIAVMSSLYLMLLTGKLSLSDVNGSSNSQEVTSVAQSSHVESLTVKDALVNTLGTMGTLMIRLAYRKYNIMMEERHGSTWAQSIGYRCRVALQSTSPAPASASPARALIQHSPTTARQFPMRFIKIPALFRADNTVYRRTGSCNDLKRWQIIVLYGCGGVGYVMSLFLITVAQGNESIPAIQHALPVVAMTGLSGTVIFWLYFLSCCQRQLLMRLCTSFDFVFLLAQLAGSDVSACDMLLWNWALCCGIFAEHLWMIWVLLLDALTPTMKARLKLKTWFGVLVIVLHIVKQWMFLSDVLIWKHWSIQNRMLLNTSIGGSKIQWRVFPFLFSRHLTVMIWCVRILHRIWTRKSKNDLVMLLGNVEFDCQPTVVESIVPATESQRSRTPE